MLFIFLSFHPGTEKVSGKLLGSSKMLWKGQHGNKLLVGIPLCEGKVVLCGCFKCYKNGIKWWLCRMPVSEA